MEEKVRGILLHSLPYLGNARILKVFTAEWGLIPLMAKGKKWPGCTTPFCEAEWVFAKGKGELYKLKDATLLESFSRLKENFSTLTAAGTIANDLLHSQLPAKKGDGLYALVLSYFKKLPTFQRTERLTASFRLKLLLWEGLLSLRETCAACERRATALISGESVCLDHGFKGIAFEEGEWETLCTLAFSRQFSALQALEISPKFQEKIHTLLCERLG